MTGASKARISSLSTAEEGKQQKRENLTGNHTVCTPEIAFTTVDLPCATWPMVPMLMVAWRDMTYTNGME
jgi:hypothetical protein